MATYINTYAAGQTDTNVFDAALLSSLLRSAPQGAELGPDGLTMDFNFDLFNSFSFVAQDGFSAPWTGTINGIFTLSGVSLLSGGEGFTADAAAVLRRIARKHQRRIPPARKGHVAPLVDISRLRRKPDPRTGAANMAACRKVVEEPHLPFGGEGERERCRSCNCRLRCRRCARSRCLPLRRSTGGALRSLRWADWPFRQSRPR